ncbi:MAG: hypothetical protein ACE14L_11745 [Terriglobales bacterium]
MSSDTTWYLSGGLLVLVVLVLMAQRPSREKFPGSYPQLEPPVAATFKFEPQRVRIAVPKQLQDMRLVVFAYDDSGHMYGVLKSVNDGQITVNAGDNADLVLDVRQGRIGDYELLKRMDRYVRQVDMLERLRDASQNGRHVGVQRCLFPLCTRCIDGCKSVISGGDLPIEMQLGAGGEIRPVFSKGKCPRCGKCFTWCPLNVFVKAASVSNQGS